MQLVITLLYVLCTQFGCTKTGMHARLINFSYVILYHFKTNDFSTCGHSRNLSEKKRDHLKMPFYNNTCAHRICCDHAILIFWYAYELDLTVSFLIHVYKNLQYFTIAICSLCWNPTVGITTFGNGVLNDNSALTNDILSKLFFLSTWDLAAFFEIDIAAVEWCTNINIAMYSGLNNYT